MQLSFAKPANGALMDPDDFSGPMMALLNSVDGYSCNVTISANPPGRTRARAALHDMVRSGLTAFTSNEANTSLAKIWFDGESEPIDLIAD